MNDPDIERFIVKELGAMQRPERLVEVVCERTGMDWNAAKEFISQVQLRHSDAIGKSKRAFSLRIASVTISGGVWMTIIAGYRIAHIARHPVGIATVACFGTGILMVIGGLIGVLRKE